MSPDEQELENCRREMGKLLKRAIHHREALKMAHQRLGIEMSVEAAILARIEAAKGTTDG